MKEALEAAGIWPIKEYTRRQQATIEEYIDTSPIYKLCKRVERMQGTSRMMRWLDQYHSRVEGDANDGVEWQSMRVTGKNYLEVLCGSSHLLNYRKLEALVHIS